MNKYIFQLKSRITTAKIPLIFISLYFIFYMFACVIQSYVAIYYDHAGMTNRQISIALSLSIIATICGQFFFGNIADIAKSKKRVLCSIFLVLAFIPVVLIFTKSFIPVLLVSLLMYFIQAPTYPVLDAICFESAHHYGFKYSPIRLFATLGYAVMAIVAGFVAATHINNVFIMISAVVLVSFVISLFIPNLSGHKKTKQMFNPFALFLKSDYLSLFIVTIAINITYGFHLSFFPIYLTKNLGFSTSIMGIIAFVSVIFEIIFLGTAGKVVKRFSIKTIFISSAVLTILRWLLYAFSTNVYLILLGASVQGYCVVSLQYCLSIYIFKTTPRNASASAQSFIHIVNSGFARVLGTFISGFLLSYFTTQSLYLGCSVFICIILIVFLLFKTKYISIE